MNQLERQSQESAPVDYGEAIFKIAQGLVYDEFARLSAAVGSNPLSGNVEAWDLRAYQIEARRGD